MILVGVYFKKAFCVLMCLVFFFLCSCSDEIKSEKDELSAYAWSAELENKTAVTLSFSEDKATLKAELQKGEKLTLSGFCELYDDYFVIHDEKTKYPYEFFYNVHFDRVELIYGDNTVSLYKRE